MKQKRAVMSPPDETTQAPSNRWLGGMWWMVLPNSRSAVGSGPFGAVGPRHPVGPRDE
jgi:hypothetical protein